MSCCPFLLGGMGADPTPPPPNIGDTVANVLNAVSGSTVAIKQAFFNPCPAGQVWIQDPTTKQFHCAMTPPPAPVPGGESTNWIPWVVGGVVVIGAIAYFAKKRK